MKFLVNNDKQVYINIDIILIKLLAQARMFKLNL